MQLVADRGEVGVAALSKDPRERRRPDNRRCPTIALAVLAALVNAGVIHHRGGSGQRQMHRGAVRDADVEAHVNRGEGRRCVVEGQLGARLTREAFQSPRLAVSSLCTCDRNVLRDDSPGVSGHLLSVYSGHGTQNMT